MAGDLWQRYPLNPAVLQTVPATSPCGNHGNHVYRSQSASKQAGRSEKESEPFNRQSTSPLSSLNASIQRKNKQCCELFQVANTTHESQLNVSAGLYVDVWKYPYGKRRQICK